MAGIRIVGLVIALLTLLSAGVVLAVAPTFWPFAALSTVAALAVLYTIRNI